MAAPRFVHLRLHTEYSIVDGMARVDDAVAAAAADGMPALAITDASNLFGAIKFYEAARAAGVQPSIGCDLWITNERNRDAAVSRDAARAATTPGYLALCDAAHARARREPLARARRGAARVAAGPRGPDRALGRRQRGDVGVALASGNGAQADGARARSGPPISRAPSTSSCSASTR